MTAPFFLNEKATIERRAKARDPEYGTESDVWEVVAPNIWCNTRDVLPSRSEKIENGRQIATQTTRFRCRKYIQIAGDMRVVLHGKGNRVMQVISGPAHLDDRVHVECMLEGYGDG